MREIRFIVVHCSASYGDQDFGFVDIDRWHREKGWNGCGYHFVVRRDGTIEHGRLEEVEGAHVLGYNENSIGICWIGGKDREGKCDYDNRTIPQRNSLANLVHGLMAKYPEAEIRGHRDFPGVRKACPCFDVSTEY